jgi:hypothetical protein
VDLGVWEHAGPLMEITSMPVAETVLLRSSVCIKD